MLQEIMFSDFLLQSQNKTKQKGFGTNFCRYRSKISEENNNPFWKNRQ